MKLLIFSYEFPPWSGGIGTYARELADALGRAGHRVTVLAPDYAGSTGTTPGAGGNESGAFELVRFPSDRGLGGAFGIWRAAGRLDSVYESVRPDWVIALDLHAAIVAGVLQSFGAARDWKTAAVVHGSELHHLSVGRLAGRFGRKFYLGCGRLFANSEWTSQLVSESVLSEARSRTQVAGIGVSRRFLDAPVSPEDVRSLRREWSIEDSQHILLTVARLVPRKGIDLVLEALSRLKSRMGNRWRYVVVGKGPEEANLEARISDLGLTDHVRLAGALPSSRLIAAYDAAALYVQLSRELGGDVEGLGITYLEAGARGLPVVACRHGGVPEAVDHGSGGYLVPTDDLDVAVERLDQLMGDEAARTRLGEGARRYVRSRFDWDLVQERMVGELDLARPSPVRAQNGRPHVVLVAPLFPPLHSGAGQQAYRVARTLSSRFRITVLTLGGQALPQEEAMGGLRVVRVADAGASGAPRRFAISGLRRLVREDGPDLLWILGVGPMTYALLAWARYKQIPTVLKFTLEGQDDPASLRERSLGSIRARFLRYPEVLICPTPRLAEMARREGLDPARIEVIPNGVELPEDVSSGEDAAGGETAVREPFSLAFVGPIIERKRVQLVIDAVDRLRDRFPQVGLHLVGDGGRDPSYEQQMRQRAADLGPHVVFHGRVDNPWDVVGNCDLFVLPSAAEGLPNALLEAMAHGLIPVVSDLPALRDVVTPEVGRRVFEATAVAWSDAIEALWHALPTEANERRRRARALIRETYALETTCQRHGEIFESLLG